MRVDGPTLAALATTLTLYADGRAQELPIWAMATTDVASLEARSRALAEAANGTVEDGLSMIGGGSTPGNGVPSPVIRFPKGDTMYRTMLDADPPVLARRDAGDLLVDLRAVPPELDGHLRAVLTH